jgi:hypothetical protein
MRRLVLLAASALALAGCFTPSMPQCSYACGDNGACPEGYTCAPEGYCKLEGFTGACPYPDASVPDLAEPADLSMSDMSMQTDMSSGDDGGDSDGG